MKLGIMIEGQEGLTLDGWTRIASVVEDLGYESLWRSDHFLSLMDGGRSAPETWTTLTQAALETRRIRFGPLVSPMTFRHPSMLIRMATVVDRLSGGRLVLGVGAGWNEREHQAYGITFPSARDRVDMLGEALELMRLLETQERATFRGRFYRLEEAPFEPKPLQGHIPVLIGTAGKRMLRHVARYADLWDGGEDAEAYAANAARLSVLCREIGRDPSEIRMVFSAYSQPLQSVDAFRSHVTRYAAIGVRTFLFNTPFSALPPLFTELAERVIPELREAYAAGDLGS